MRRAPLASPDAPPLGRRALLVALLAAACGNSTPPAKNPGAARDAQGPALHDGPLTDYVAAAGLRWMVVGDPERIAESAVAEKLEPLLPASRLDLWAASTGIELRRTHSALVAGFDYATLYAATTTTGNRRIEERFADRLLTTPRVHRPHPRIARITGVVGETPETLVSIDATLAAVCVGDPTPARVVELFAIGKLRRSRPALAGSALSTLPVAELDRRPVRFYAPGPFRGEWLAGAQGLLGAALGVGIAAQPAGKDRVAVLVALSGEWTADAETRLLAAWQELADSSLGRLLGFDEPAAPPATTQRGDVLRIEVELLLAPIVAGLRAAVAADIWEILDLVAPGAAKNPGNGAERPAPTP